MKTLIIFAALITMSLTASAQPPQIGTGVSHELAKWRSARYSDVRYKLNLTLEKMSPLLKGTMEIRVRVIFEPSAGRSAPNVVEVEGVDVPGTVLLPPPALNGVPIILDWRRLKGHEEKSIVSNVSVNGRPAVLSTAVTTPSAGPKSSGSHPSSDKEGSAPLSYVEQNEHLIFRDGVVVGENVITLDFTSPILTSGSAITRYVDKEDGAEYIYSLFVPSDASTAFPVFDQPDLKARFTLETEFPNDWTVTTNSPASEPVCESPCFDQRIIDLFPAKRTWKGFEETKPISTYVFAFAAGPWERVGSPHVSKGSTSGKGNVEPSLTVGLRTPETSTYVRKSQAAKFKPHAAEVFRLNREAVKYFEEYFDYKFPFPKYDLVLIPEFPFGGMEHAGATFLRESSIIFPQEPTKNDHINRATLIFHEAAHQWFGDTVTMRWFDDLWLKEGFATFTAYKAMEKIMPEMNAWKVFYERIKQAAYQTDSTKGTTPIYQEIKNLSAAKSAYGNIVYNKAPAFLRQAEFYLGEDKFQTAVRAFLKKHEFGNAGWEDLVSEFEKASRKELDNWSRNWVTQRGMNVYKVERFKLEPRTHDPMGLNKSHFTVTRKDVLNEGGSWSVQTRILLKYIDGTDKYLNVDASETDLINFRDVRNGAREPFVIFPNYGDYGYGIFLLDEKSRDYVLKNIQNEKDPFLRTMMWGALWDSLREGELDPRVFVELVVKVLGPGFSRPTTPSAQSGGHPSSSQEGSKRPPEGGTPNEDESTVATLLGRSGTALNYYIDDATGRNASVNERASGAQRPEARSLTVASPPVDLRRRVEDLLIERMQNAPTLGQRITYYRAFLNIAASEKARGVLKGLLATGGNLSGSEGVPNVEPRSTQKNTLPTGRVSASIPLKTKDRFDIVSRLLILNDPEAPKLLADLEKAETSDEAKRYAYAAKAGIATAENKAKYWNDFVSNREISESWIEAAFGPWNSIRHSDLTLPYLERALKELPNHKRSRKIFFVNGWLGAFIGGQRSPEALAIVNKFLADNPGLDNDLRLKILENVDLIERAVNIRRKFPQV